MAIAGQQSTTIGVFRDRSLAEQAIDELKHAGFRDEQISLVRRHSGSALGGLRGLFSAHADATERTAQAAEDDMSQDALPQELAGVPMDQAPFYHQELNAGHSIVVVRSDLNGGQQAHDILYRHGAYDAGAATGAGFSGAVASTRTVPIREERLDVSKQTVQVGEIRIHKRVITENKTFTVPVRREEVYIERVPARGEDDALANMVNAQGVEFNRGVTSLGSTSQGALQGYEDPTNTAAPEPLETQSSPNPFSRLVHGRNASTSNADTQDTIAQEQAVNDEMLHDGGTIRILLREERVVINKYPVVVEEILVRKQPVQETRTINETVRHEEPTLERAGDFVVHGDGAGDMANPQE